MSLKKHIMKDIRSAVDEYTIDRLLPTAEVIHKFAQLLSGGTEQFPNKEKAIEFIIASWDYSKFSEFVKAEFETKLDDGKHKYKKYDELDKATATYQSFLEKFNKKYPDSTNYMSGKNYESKLNSIRRLDITFEEKERLIEEETVRSLHTFELNQLRNDSTEAILYKAFKNNITPTLKNIKGVDFYINGVAFDVKNSRSLGLAFMKTHIGKDKNLDDSDYKKAKEFAIKHSGKLSESLFSNQSLARFSSDELQNKLYIASSNPNKYPSLAELTSSIKHLNINVPLKVKSSIDVLGNIEEYKFLSYEIII